MFNLIPWRRRETTRSDNPLALLRNEFDSLFDRFLGWTNPMALDEWSGQNGWGLEMKDEDKELVVRAEAPGFEAEDFDVQVQGNVLTIRAQRKQETGKKDEDNFAYSERRLERSVTLPAEIDHDKVQATYRNGILELHLPKSPEAQGRRIEVKKSFRCSRCSPPCVISANIGNFLPPLLASSFANLLR
jgi:HSP20 family protein